MSGPLAVAAVTAVLKDLLTMGLMAHDLSSIGSYSVTALPPDRIPTGHDEPNQLNLFLYHLTPNLGWRNEGLPSRDGRGSRVANAPLALDLHYLLTAYGAADLNAEVLLGFAMQMLHETQALSRARLRAVLGPPSPFGTLSAVDLAEQIEVVKISPVYLNTEELSKLWTAMQSRYRPTMAYTVSVVLIQADAPVSAPPPVLKRGKDDTGPGVLGAPPTTLTRILPGASDLLPAMRLGDELRLFGSGLDVQEPVSVVFDNGQAGLAQALVPQAPGTGRQLKVRLPDPLLDPGALHEWAVGMYAVALQVEPPGATAWRTNSVPIALAPRIEIAPSAAPAGDLTLTVVCRPRLQPRQHAHVRLLFGPRTLAPATIDTPALPAEPTTLTFEIKAAAPGDYLVRLRVDGIDSLPVTVTGDPPRFDFDTSQKVSVT